jgi:hypothetical protein
MGEVSSVQGICRRVAQLIIKSVVEKVGLDNLYQ